MSFVSCIVLAFAAVAPAPALTIYLRGSLMTTATVVIRYAMTVPVGVNHLTLNVPLPRSDGAFGWSQSSQWKVESSPAPDSETHVTDADGNDYDVVVFDSPAAGSITVSETLADATISTRLDDPLPPIVFPIQPSIVPPAGSLAADEYSQSTDPAIAALSAKITKGAANEAGAAERIARWVDANFSYADGDVPEIDASWTLGHKMGQCNGLTHLFVALARASGLPARVACGYTLGSELTFPASATGESTLTVGSHNERHSWAEVWFPGAGWTPYDPQSSSGFIDTHHIRLHVGLSSRSGRALVTWRSGARSGTVHIEETSEVTAIHDKTALQFAGSARDGSDIVLLARLSKPNVP